MNDLSIKIINIDDKSQINKLHNINLTNPKIIIKFEESSINIFNDFISKYINLINIYVNNNNQINIDIIEHDFELYLFFLECVEKAYNNILNSGYDLKLFGDINNWNFSIVQNVMFNFPFTLENIIYMPLQYLKDNFISKDYKSLTRTIIHEKLHIGQRYNEEIWNKYINLNNINWIKINKNDEKFNIVENNIKNNKNNLINVGEEFILNPDSLYDDFKYLYQIDNNLYYGHYVYDFNTKKIFIKYFLIDIEKNTLIKTNKKFEQEHPYETYAYMISEKII